MSLMLADISAFHMSLQQCQRSGRLQAALARGLGKQVAPILSQVYRKALLPPHLWILNNGPLSLSFTTRLLAWLGNGLWNPRLSELGGSSETLWWSSLPNWGSGRKGAFPRSQRGLKVRAGSIWLTVSVDLSKVAWTIWVREHLIKKHSVDPRCEKKPADWASCWELLTAQEVCPRQHSPGPCSQVLA